jgi:hypothetical protein
VLREINATMAVISYYKKLQAVKKVAFNAVMFSSATFGFITFVKLLI